MPIESGAVCFNLVTGSFMIASFDIFNDFDIHQILKFNDQQTHSQ